LVIDSSVTDVTSVSRILVVDDELPLLDLAKEFLALTSDFDVDTASSAIIGLQKFKDVGYDAIVSDYQMPGMNGIEFLKEVRKMDGIPFILLTGRGREEVAIEAINSGADFYIKKGGDPKAEFTELSNAIKQAVTRRQAEKAQRQAQERHRALYESMMEAYARVDMNGRITESNQSFQLMCGYGREELSQMSYSDITPEKWHKMEAKIFQEQLFERGYTEIYQKEYRRKDGTIFPVELHTFLIRDETGHQVGMWAIVRDITDRKQAEKELLQERDRAQKYLDLAGFIFLALDKEARITMLNRKGCRIVGCIDAPIGKSWLDFIPETIRKDMGEIYRQLNSGELEVIEYYEYPIRTVSGDERLIAWHNTALRDENGMIVGTLSSGEDITDRQRASEEMKNLAERSQKIIELARIVDSSRDGVIGKDLKGVITSWNKGAEIIYGYSESEMVGHQSSLLDDPDSKDDFQEIITRVLHGELIDHETTRLAKGERRIDVSLTISPVLDDRGNIIGSSTIAREITEKKLAERELRENKERFQTYLDNSPEGIFIVDAKGNYQDVNKTAYCMLNYSREELLNLNFVNITDPNVLQDALDKFKLLQEKGSMSMETILMRKDGIRLPVFLNAVGLPGHRFMAFCTDITERKRVEGALHQASSKLNLLSSITRHDINNQIMVLMGNLELMKRKGTDHASNQHLKQAEEAAERISAMIQFTKEYENVGLEAPTWQDVRALVERCIKDVSIGQIKTVNDVPSGTEVFADPMIIKVVENLMNNSIRHGEDVKIIHFYLKEQDGIHAIVCDDDGVGIPSEMKEKLFTKGFGKDHGLGLFLSREILAITGISITEEGEPGRGAKFIMKIPQGGFRAIQLECPRLYSDTVVLSPFGPAARKTDSVDSLSEFRRDKL